MDVILSYAHYSLQNTTLTSLVPFLKSKDIGIINASPLSLGLLGPHVRISLLALLPVVCKHVRDLSRYAVRSCASELLY